VFVPGKSRVKVQPEIVDIFLGVLYVVYMDWGARFSSSGQCDVDRLGFISFNLFWIPARLICSFCEALAGSQPVTSTPIIKNNFYK
jgi:hypothetical protein